ncbi:MAG: hypothetical protein ACLPZY_10550 [Terracidiphilus sp.]
MKECAFCMQPAKLSGEHVHSDWMNTIIRGPWKREMNSSLGLNVKHDSPELNWKIKVVCEKCNNGWMSRLEDKIAKPVLTPLIGGEVNIPIPQSSADSIAAFAFKTAIIIDLLRDGDGFEPFFSRRIRANFKKTHAIPNNVNMWMCAYLSPDQRADARIPWALWSAPALPISMFIFYCRHEFSDVSVSCIVGRLLRFRDASVLMQLVIEFWVIWKILEIKVW